MLPDEQHAVCPAQRRAMAAGCRLGMPPTLDGLPGSRRPPQRHGRGRRRPTVVAGSEQAGATRFRYGWNWPTTYGMGLIVGGVRGRVLVVDDVITAGTAIREVLSIIDGQGATCAGVAIGLDRQERGQGELSAIQEIEQEFDLQVVNIVNLLDLIEYLQRMDGGSAETLESMEAYRAEYGVA